MSTADLATTLAATAATPVRHNAGCNQRPRRIVFRCPILHLFANTNGNGAVWNLPNVCIMNTRTALNVSLGLTLGVAIGLALGNVTLGIGIGLALGIALGLAKSSNSPPK
jgi:hypothetical protein